MIASSNNDDNELLKYQSFKIGCVEYVVAVF